MFSSVCLICEPPLAVREGGTFNLQIRRILHGGVKVMFNKLVGGFYRGINIKPLGFASWLYTPIKPDPRVYGTTSKTFLEKRVSMELITMTLL